jgi:hypothetical protein
MVLPSFAWGCTGKKSTEVALLFRFGGDGVLAEKVYWKAVEQLVDEYEGSAKKRK